MYESTLTIFGSGNGLSPGRSQAISWTYTGILLIGPLGTYFTEILENTAIFIDENDFKIVAWQMAAILSLPQCVNFN